ncbi:hypothetical protein EXIGLDRAFT_836189 [Exidia glandulosa HHB12029]|uniref:Uncharacterized protein n=1 Tax=Exidia glandulosa HHB12029 TaxID=1314781 RepID=A0A165I0Z5_EXIGL|nr:hypothetical protein EXIGLDRAFT_836189 [Exidia glandulosa HHB12029]
MSTPSTPNEPLRRRLSARRGSMSAPDPYALHAEAETERAITSRLTIVRVPSQQQSQPPTPGAGSGPPSRRSSWGSSVARSSGRDSPGSAGVGGGRARLSFAFSTFTPINPPAGSESPVLERPPSKQRTYSNPSLAPFAQGKKLTPQELIELAQNPTSSAPSTPLPQSESQRQPAPFTPLPADVLLPFLDRPSEVAQLVNTPPTSRLFALLCQALPTENTSAETPESWGTAELTHHLTSVPREVLGDKEWALAIKACAAPRSELLWERLKGALGVPPDLEDQDDEEDEPEVLGLDEALDDEYDDPLEDEDDEDEPESWVEPIYAADQLGSQIASASPVAEKQGSDGTGSSYGGMEIIGESEREEEGNAKDTPTPPPPAPEEPIQGIRIYTSTVPVSPGPRSARSFSHGAHSMEPAGGGGGLQRSSSSSSAQMRRRFSSALHMTDVGGARGALGRSNTTGGARGRGAVGMVQPHLERGVGNPLFVSSFATLSAGPTLATSNPSLRYSRVRGPGPSRLGPGSSAHEYAVSATSGSEREFI